MPALPLTETTCVSQAAGQGRRQAWGLGLGGEMQDGPMCALEWVRGCAGDLGSLLLYK